MTVALEVSGVRTTTDGGIRITLDLPETATDLAAWLMACKAQGIALQTAFVKINPNAGQEEE